MAVTIQTIQHLHNIKYDHGLDLGKWPPLHVMAILWFELHGARTSNKKMDDQEKEIERIRRGEGDTSCEVSCWWKDWHLEYIC